MRNFFVILLITILFSSCSFEDNNNLYLEIIPIESVSLPETFINGEIYEISYTYLRPTSCHYFNNLYYFIEEDERTIAVINAVFEENGDGSSCTNLEEEIITRNFEFIANNETGDSYTFKFWQGEDNNGNDIYLTINIPVVE